MNHVPPALFPLCLAPLAATWLLFRVLPALWYASTRRPTIRRHS